MENTQQGGGGGVTVGSAALRGVYADQRVSQEKQPRSVTLTDTPSTLPRPAALSPARDSVLVLLDHQAATGVLSFFWSSEVRPAGRGPGPGPGTCCPSLPALIFERGLGGPWAPSTLPHPSSRQADKGQGGQGDIQPSPVFAQRVSEQREITSAPC
ncbi:unnamed protein product [Arctogadus glacialis]